MKGNLLSIWLRPDGFSYRADDGEMQRVPIAPGDDFHRRMEDAMLGCDTMLGEYAAISCRVETTRFALVPPEADAATAQAMYRLTQSEPERPEVVLRDGPVLFALDEDFYHFMQRTFDGDVTYRHPLNSLRTLCGDTSDAPAPAATSAPSLAPAQVIAYVGFDSLDILVYRNTLQLANRYETSELNNMAYYVMNTWQRCELDALRDQLILTGDASQAARLRVQLALMVKNLRVQTYQDVDKSMPD